MSQYTLGLDIGANSVGWALVDADGEHIVDIGVRVFPEGVDRDTKGLEKSKNVARREARGARRVHQRRRLRRQALVSELRAAGLLPRGNEALEQLVAEKAPYELRAKGLDTRLELYEFGRVLYHINQRRGFKSNRKSARKKEDGLIAKKAGELQQAIERASCQTLGEYFATINPEEERIRGHYTFRGMYEHEFDMLWEKQASFYPKVLTDSLRAVVRDKIIFFQRPLKPTAHLIGDCDLEVGQKRCPRDDWHARRYRILQDVNNLRVVDPDGSVRELREEERREILEEMDKKKSVGFSALRKKLGLLETQKFNAEYEINERGKTVEKLSGNGFAAHMRSKKVFGAKTWDAMTQDQQKKLNEMFVELDDDELQETLIGQYGLSEEQTEEALKVELPRGYMRFSRKAIAKLLVLMEEGERTDEALRAVYPERGKGPEELQERLPLPEDVRNPLVNRAMFEVRKVVNAVLREYGRPEEIVVEMARDVKGNSRERREQHWKAERNRKRNEDVREKLRQDLNMVNPTRDDVIKYKLWEECGRMCPYTGKTISQNALFGPNPEFQVEHILPYPRSLDDSYMNKALCEVRENRRKGNDTPYECYGADAARFDALKQRVNASSMPYWKKRRFWQQGIDTDEIIKRELNDTRYASRQAATYLRQICTRVRGSRGKTTSELAYQWGFVKDREDHRHHAIDAAVVAVTRPTHLRELGRTKYATTAAGFPAPWPHFREELLEKVKNINVSHRPTRKVSGALHEETNYGVTELPEDNERRVYVYRKRLEDLTIAMVDKILDPVVRDIVRARLTDSHVDLSKGGKPPKDVWAEPLYMRTTTSDKKVPIKKVRIAAVLGNAESIQDRQGKPYRHVKPGNNHHVEIWESPQDDKAGKRDARVVSMFEAIRRSRAGEPVVQRDHGTGTQFVCSLAINDMVMLPVEKDEMGPYRVQKMNVHGQVYFRHHAAATIDDDSTLIRKQATLFDGYKVIVDCLGRVHQAND